jgi:excisionase family DNA binding protein
MNTQNVSEQVYLNRAETAKLLRITLVSLYNFTKQGKIPAYRLGSRVLYKRAEIDACLSKVRTS